MPKHKSANRRWQAALIVSLVGIAVAAAAFGGWWYARESPPHQGPIVLVSITGLGAGDLAAYGGHSSSPAIDALADDGIVFDRVYAHALQTLPAHASLLTGLLPIDHHVRDNAGFTLAGDVRTLAELLRNRGFSTGAAVSSFLLRPRSGIAQGFSFFDGELGEATVDAAPAVERDGTATWEAAERWMRRQNGQRFFLLLQTRKSDADRIVARLVSSLRERGLYEPATVVVVGDPASASSATAFTEQALRVPLVVKQPEEAGAGRHVDTPVQHVDLAPTLLDVVRAPIPSGLRGRSLRPLLDDEDAAISSQPIYTESLDAYFELGGAPIFALASGTHRYVRGATEIFTAIGPEGDEHQADPRSPEANQLRSALERLLADRTIDVPTPVSQSEEDRYAMLGYLPRLRPTTQADAAANDPSVLSAHRSIARLVGEKRFSTAIESLRALARSRRSLPILQYQLGLLFVRTGRLDEAVAAFRAAAASLPDAYEIPLSIADALMQSGRFDDAAAQAALGIALAEHVNPPARAAAHEVALRIALARNDFATALQQADEAHEADASRPLPQFVRGRQMYSDGRYEDALAAFQEAAAAVGDRGTPLRDLHYYLADTFARLDRYDDAERQFRQELELFPRSIRPYSSLAMLYRASNRHRDVERVIRDLMEAVPTPEGYAMAARLWMILGERSRAEAVRLDARSRFRGDPSLALLERRR